MTKKPTKLTPTQLDALKTVIDNYDKIDANERSRWGKAYGGYVDWTGLGSTLNVLTKQGLVEVKHTLMVTNRMCRGSYGRWIGGTRRNTHIETGVRPTSKGRAIVD